MSIDEKYIRMMNEEIDGIISDADADSLDMFVRSDPEAAKYYEELQAAVRAIDDTGEVEPPPELRDRIFDSVYGRSGRAAAVRPPERHTFWRSFVPVFAAGVAAGFILLAAIRELPDRSREEPGHGATIGAARNGSQTAEKFDAHGVRGSILPLFESGSVTVTIQITSGEDASILLEFEDGTSFESIRSNEGAAYQMEVDGKSLLLVHQGEAEYIARFRSEGPAQIVAKIFSGGQTIAAMKFAGAE
jgi:hypothetical protein